MSKYYVVMVEDDPQLVYGPYSLKSAKDFARIGSQRGGAREVVRGISKPVKVRRYEGGKRVWPKEEKMRRHRRNSKFDPLKILMERPRRTIPKGNFFVPRRIVLQIGLAEDAFQGHLIGPGLDKLAEAYHDNLQVSKNDIKKAIKDCDWALRRTDNEAFLEIKNELLNLIGGRAHPQGRYAVVGPRGGVHSFLPTKAKAIAEAKKLAHMRGCQFSVIDTKG
jgi:hypothetical protein